jgi:hypothetical protein
MWTNEKANSSELTLFAEEAAAWLETRRSYIARTTFRDYGIFIKTSLLAREVAELHREKMELLEENASLKKGLAFMLGRYFSPGDCRSCPFSCQGDEQ